MIASLSNYVSLSDVILLGTIVAVGLLTFRSQRPRILKEENDALAEENKKLREEKADWVDQKAEFVAQIRTLENRITILEGKDTERLYDLMKGHDDRAAEIASQVSAVLQGLSDQITAHIDQQQDFRALLLPLAREIQQHLQPRDGND